MKATRVLLLLLVLVLTLAACGGAERDDSGTVVEEGEVSAFDVTVGDCFGDPGEDEVSSLEALPCTEPHDNEAYHLADFPAGPDEPFPGEEEIDAFAEETCVAAFEDYVGLSFDESVLQVTYLQPTEGTWEDGDREVVCTLYSDDGQLTGSMKDSKE